MARELVSLHVYEVHYRTARIDSIIGREGIFVRDADKADAHAARTIAAATEDGYTLDTERLDAEARAHVDMIIARRAGDAR